MKKIVTSLSICVRHIFKGTVLEEDVAFIVTSTSYPSREDMITQFALANLGKDIHGLMEIVTRLWDQGKIYQSSNRVSKDYFEDIWIDVDIRTESNKRGT
jgi:hypothetical protein